MHTIANQHIVFIVLTVLLFIALGIVMLILIDHKSRIPGEFQSNPFGISGMRREHPVIAFVTTITLFAIIFSLLLELFIVLGEHTGAFGQEEEKPAILKKISQHRYSETQRHFHNVPKMDKVNMGNKPVCFECHGDFPHSKQKMIRTLLNMHTQFIGCMTCHVDPKKIAEKNYQFKWLNYSGIKVNGVPYGTDVNPVTGYLVDTDDFYSKIVIYDNEINEGSLIEITGDDPDVKEFLQVKDSLSDEDKEAIKKQFHARIMTKGRFCSRCHTEEVKSFMPFRSLGFSEKRIQDVTNLNIVGIVEKYNEFYMPNLFNTDKSLPSIKTILGDNKKIDVPNEELLKGRAWWRHSNDSEKMDK